MVQFSMTLSDPEPQFQGHSIVYRQISRKRCIRSTPRLVLGQGFRGRRIEWRYLQFDKIQDGGWRPSWIYKNGYKFATALPIDVMFGSSMRFSGSADLVVQLSVTLSDPEPQFQSHSIVKGEYLANGASNPFHVWF